jgi:hypothetical protein
MPFDTYILINQFTVTTASSGFNFLSIPQTFTDLRMLIYSQNGGTVYTFPNNDTTANKSRTNLFVNAAQANGSSGGANGNTGIFIDAGFTTNYPGCTTVDFMSYAQTDKFKTICWRWAIGNSTSAANGFWVANYNSTNAITALHFSPEGGYTFEVGSTFRLYGIKRES